MKRKYFSFSSFARRLGLFRQETGVSALEFLVVLAIGVAAAAVALTEIRRALPDNQKKQLDALVFALQQDLNAINVEIQVQKNDGIENPTLPADSEVVIDTKEHIQQAQDLIKNNSKLVQPAIIDQVEATLNDVTSCQILQPGGEVQAIVGKPITIQVVARIPLNDPNATGSIKSNNPADASGVISRDKGFTWSGFMTLLGKENVQVGSVTTLTVTATTSGESPVTCTSTNAIAVQWQPPPPAKIESFTAKPTEILLGQPASLSYKFTDAESATITPGNVRLGIQDKGKGEGKIPVSPKETTEYTLTAVSPGGNATASAKVTLKSPPTGVTITAPAEAISLVSTDTMTVSGIVSPVPPPEFRSAQIRVNGVPAATALINSAGQFSIPVELTKKTTADKLSVVNPDHQVAGDDCGEHKEPVSVAVKDETGEDVKNTIEVVVELGGEQATASVVVYHLAGAKTFHLVWDGDCGCEDQHTDALNPVIYPRLIFGDDLFGHTLVGDVLCQFPQSINCTDHAHVTVETSVGQLEAPTATWQINLVCEEE